MLDHTMLEAFQDELAKLAAAGPTRVIKKTKRMSKDPLVQKMEKLDRTHAQAQTDFARGHERAMSKLDRLEQSPAYKRFKEMLRK